MLGWIIILDFAGSPLDAVSFLGVALVEVQIVDESVLLEVVVL